MDLDFDDPWLYQGTQYRPTEVFLPVELIARPILSYVKGEDRHQWVGALATGGPMESDDCGHHHPTADEALECAQAMADDLTARVLASGRTSDR